MPVASGVCDGTGLETGPLGHVLVLTGASDLTCCLGHACTRSGCSGVSAAMFYQKKLAWHSWVW